MNKIKKLLVYPIAVLAVIISAPAAFAVTDLRDTYMGLVLNRSGVKLGQLNISDTYESVNIYGRYDNDFNGTRMQVRGEVKDTLLDNGQEIYAKGEYWSNGAYCYISGIGVGETFSTSITCTDGWYPNGGQSQFSDQSSSIYTPYKFKFERALGVKSQQIALRVCEDEPWFQSDECSLSRLLGIDWN